MTAPYAALGDSYAAGVGGGASRGVCWRADDGYPVLVGRTLGVDVAYEACLGAIVPDVERFQLHALGPGTQLVTITIGGNDIGFVPVLIACAEPAWMRDSDPVIDKALHRIRLELPGRLDRVLAEIGRRAPRARVVVTGYPRLFNGIDCNLATFFTGHEMDRMNAAADELAAAIASAAGRVGAGFVDVLDDFAGHAVCDDPEWVNGVNQPIEGSFHPNVLGHGAYALAVLHLLGPRFPAAPERASRVRPGLCVAGSAPTFRLPDLTGPRSLAGATAHGLDAAEVAALGDRLRTTAAGGFPDLAAAARLHELDAEVCARLGRPR